MLFSPITYVFSRLARIFARLVGGGDAESALSIDREQIRAMVRIAERAESARAFDRGRIARVLRFADTNVAQVMVPVAEMEAIAKDVSTADAIARMRQTGHRRLPIFEGNVSKVVGIFTATPWQMMDPEFSARPVEENLREPFYINPYQSIDEVLPELWKDGMEIGIVVDEFGSAIGLLTVEDIIEEVVGEEEFDDAFIRDRVRRRHSYEMLADNVVLMDARMSLSEANEILGVDLPTGDYHTVGGLVLARFRHLPEIGEVVTEAGYRFVVAEATVRGIEKLRVEPEAAAKGEASDS